MEKPNVLICTVGTSLFYPNMQRLINAQPDEEIYQKIKEEYQNKSWPSLALALQAISPFDQTCGAEINSIASLLEKEYIRKGVLYLLHSATSDGKSIAAILKYYYSKQGWKSHVVEIPFLQDSSPKDFRTKGLRNLAKAIAKIIREHNQVNCAINATGGYKAQIAIAVLMGQSINVPVYYKHERFDEIIPFPPMPVALDFEFWMRYSGLFIALNKRDSIEPWEHFAGEWDERLESLVEKIKIEGTDYLELSPTGQIFHETFAYRFASSQDMILPPPVPDYQKEKPVLSAHDWGYARGTILNFLKKVASTPYVKNCRTYYWNPDLSQTTRFRLKTGEVEGIFSNGKWCVKFIVDTSAKTTGQKEAVVAYLNNWLEER